jgi:prephenate dehydrogenase
MNLGITGTGNIGGIIARRLSAAGHDVRSRIQEVWKGSRPAPTKSVRLRLTFLDLLSRCGCVFAADWKKEISHFAENIRRFMERIGRGEPPAVAARDCARTVLLTFDAYPMAGENG